MKGGFTPDAWKYIEKELPDPRQRALFLQTLPLLEGLIPEDKARFKEVSDGANLGYTDLKAAAGLASGRIGFYTPNMPPESHAILKRTNHPSTMEYPLEDELKVVNAEIADILKEPKELLNANNYNTVTTEEINKKFSSEIILDAFTKIFEKDKSNLKRYANNADKLKYTDTYLLIYVLIRIINTYYYLLMLNPEHLVIAKSFEETFVEIQKLLSKAELKQTILHDLVSGFIVTLDLSMVNSQIAKAKRTEDPAQRQRMILEAAFLAQLGEQRARSMQSNMLKDSFFKERSNYDLGFTGALVEGDICLDHLSMAKKRTEELYQRLVSRKLLSATSYHPIFLLYLDKLATLALTDKVLQQRLLWTLRIQPVLDAAVSDRYQQSKDKLGADIKSLFAEFKLRLNKVLENFPTLKYAPKENELAYIFEKALPKDAVDRLEKAFESRRPKLLFMMVGNNKLVLKNVTSIRLDKLSSILNETLVKFVNMGETAIKKAQEKERKHAQKAQKRAQARDQVKPPIKEESAVDSVALALEKVKLNDTPKALTQKAIVKESVEVPVVLKPKQKEQPLVIAQLQITPPKNTGKALGLENAAYHDLLFKKLENATGILVGFEEEFSIGKGNPSKELIQRFRDTICKDPKRVPPQNKNGFKWVGSDGQVLLVGKIKAEKYRLRPIYSEVTKEGKTVFVYGTVTNTKSGKRSNRV